MKTREEELQEINWEGATTSYELPKPSREFQILEDRIRDQARKIQILEEKSARFCDDVNRAMIENKNQIIDYMMMLLSKGS